MKIQHKIIGASIFIGISIWLIDAILDFFFFQEGTFLEVLVYDIHPHHLYIRLVGIGSFLIFGIIIAKIMALRKKAEDDLKYAHSDLNQVFNASVPLCVIGKDFKMLKVNNTFCNFFGLQREKVLRKKCYEIWEDKVCSTVECPLKKVGRGVGECEREIEKKLINGKTVSCIVTAIPYRSPKGELLGVVENFTDVTERNKAEEAMKIRDIALESSINAVSFVALDGTIEYINNSWLKMWGYEHKEEIIGKDPLSFWLEKNKANNVIKELYNTGSFIGELVGVKKNGSIFDVQLSAHMAKNNQGKPICMMATFLDITERKQSEMTLQESEEKYSTLVENAQDGVAIFQDGIIKFVNRATEKLFGYTVKELIGKPFLDPIVAEYREIAAQRYQKHLSGENVSSLLELKLKCKGGTIKDVEITTNLIQYNGKPAFLTFTRDITKRKKTEAELKKYRLHLEELVKKRTAQITVANEQLKKEIIERKQSEEALRKSKEQWRKYFELGLIGITVTSPEKKWIIANDYLCQILGYSRQELMEMTWAELTYPEDLLKDLKQFERVFAGKIDGYSMEKRFIRKDGKIINSIISVKCLRNPDRSVNSFLAFILDITERKKMEEELQKIDKLEAIGVLAGGIAHDFNNLLTGVLGNISMAELYIKQEDPVFEILKRAKNSSRRAGKLTKQLLTFSKGGAPIKETASISELIKEIANFTLRGSKVKCEYSQPDNLWPVNIDKGQISQVINNLIINADHAMPDGGIIELSVENVLIRVDDGLPLKEGKYIKVSVKDQGVGIPREYLDKIFDPYFTTKKHGSGLGLASCYSIVINHGGYITVESEVGAGTTFDIYLPISDKEVFEVKAIVEEKVFPGKGKILLMDDEQDVINTADQMLIKLGYEVEIAKDGTKAIEIYKKAYEKGEPFDFVILDLTIPGDMGGQEAIQKLLEIHPDIKAIVSSGYSNNPLMAEYKNYGFKGVVAKPFEIKELSKVLYRVINGIEESSVKAWCM